MEKYSSCIFLQPLPNPPIDKYIFFLIVLLWKLEILGNMACEASIRLLCIRALKAQGPEFEMHLLELFTQLKEHFESPDCAEPIVELVQNALHRPPDA
jgi:hypothetical protein